MSFAQINNKAVRRTKPVVKVDLYFFLNTIEPWSWYVYYQAVIKS